MYIKKSICQHKKTDLEEMFILSKSARMQKFNIFFAEQTTVETGK